MNTIIRKLADRESMMLSNNLALSKSRNHYDTKHLRSCKVVSFSKSVDSSPNSPVSILVFCNGERILIKVAEILYCKSNGNYTSVYLNDQSSYFVSKTLKTLSQEINNPIFIRCHQSYFVNKDFIKRITRDKKIIIESEGVVEHIPIARRRFVNVLRALDS